MLQPRFVCATRSPFPLSTFCSVRKMQSYSADKPAAEGFAREARLASNRIDYPEGGKR